MKMYKPFQLIDFKLTSEEVKILRSIQNKVEINLNKHGNNYIPSGRGRLKSFVNMCKFLCRTADKEDYNVPMEVVNKSENPSHTTSPISLKRISREIKENLEETPEKDLIFEKIIQSYKDLYLDFEENFKRRNL